MLLDELGAKDAQLRYLVDTKVNHARMLVLRKSFIKRHLALS